MLYIIGGLIIVNVIMTICVFVLKDDLCHERAYKVENRNTIEHLQSIRIQLENENNRLKKDMKEIRRILQ